MNKDHLARHRKGQPALTDNAPAVPAFARLADQFSRQLALLDGTAQRHAATSAGATPTKPAAGTALIGRLVITANALCLLYKTEAPANLAEAAPLPRRPSDCANLTAQELATEAHALARRVTDRQAELIKNYNFRTADVQALAAGAAAFDGQLVAPQLAIDAAKMEGATATATLSALNDFLRDDLRASTELLRDTHPAAYAALREATQGTMREAGRKRGEETIRVTRTREAGSFPLARHWRWPASTGPTHLFLSFFMLTQPQPADAMTHRSTMAVADDRHAKFSGGGATAWPGLKILRS